MAKNKWLKGVFRLLSSCRNIISKLPSHPRSAQSSWRNFLTIKEMIEAEMNAPLCYEKSQRDSDD